MSALSAIVLQLLHCFAHFRTVLQNTKMRPCWLPNQGQRSNRLIYYAHLWIYNFFKYVCFRLKCSYIWIRQLDHILSTDSKKFLNSQFFPYCIALEQFL